MLGNEFGETKLTPPFRSELTGSHRFQLDASLHPLSVSHRDWPRSIVNLPFGAGHGKGHLSICVAPFKSRSLVPKSLLVVIEVGLSTARLTLRDAMPTPDLFHPECQNPC